MPQAPGLRYWRERRALTMRELAARAGVTLTTVHYAEHGRNAELPTIRKLAAALAVEPGHLLDPPPAPGQQAVA